MPHNDFTELLKSYNLCSHKAQVDAQNRRKVVLNPWDAPSEESIFEMAKSALTERLNYEKTQDDAARVLFTMAIESMSVAIVQQMMAKVGLHTKASPKPDRTKSRHMA